MCTVTYIPVQGGFLVSSNRDETPLRAHTPLIVEKWERDEIIYPKDKKGGSWIFASTKPRVVCVLNGAFGPHIRKTPYKMSRGLVAKEVYNHPDPNTFIHSFDFTGIEPFTLLIIEEKLLFDFRWDGTATKIRNLHSNKAHIWSSATLYSSEIQKKRLRLFQNLLKSNELSPDFVRNMHRTGSVGDPRNDFIMNRDEVVKTVSITHVHYRAAQVTMEFENLITSEVSIETRVVKNLPENLC
ncbi:MAG TPA: NRDE family protein [Saprospiraceae bacterium]|nr:NRDE family protein [Saprospiraceae bacterium]